MKSRKNFGYSDYEAGENDYDWRGMAGSIQSGLLNGVSEPVVDCNTAIRIVDLT